MHGLKHGGAPAPARVDGSAIDDVGLSSSRPSLQLDGGRKLRALAIVDIFTVFSGARRGAQCRGADAVEALDAAGRAVGFPKTIRVGNGPEFVSRDLDLWAYRREVTLDFSRPGKLTDNTFCGIVQRQFRAECLNAHWFMGLDDTPRKCEAWRRDYNEERPHSVIGHKCPVELMIGSAATDPR